jgi:hypothetical protein
MKKLLLLIVFFTYSFNSFSQSKIEDYIEGKKYKNSSTGLIIQYGYISSLNTYGITFTNSYGNKFNYMNCSKQVSSDESYMILTNCMNPDSGSGIGTIYAYRTKIIVKASDGQMQYDLISTNNFQNTPEENSSLFLKKH